MNEKLVKEKSCINNHNAKSFTIQAENLIEILLKIFPVLAFLNHIVRSNGLFSSDVRNNIMVSNCKRLHLLEFMLKQSSV